MTCGKKGFATILLVVLFVVGIASVATLSVLSQDDVITGHAIARDDVKTQDDSSQTSSSSSSTNAQENDDSPAWQPVEETSEQEVVQEAKKTTPIYTYRSGGGSGGSSGSSTQTTTTSAQNAGVGAISFSSAVDQDAVNNDVTISYNFISIPSSSAANVPATLTFQGLPYSSTPLVLQNNKVCTNDCSNVNYNAGTLTVDVDHFTNYTTVGNYPACDNSLITAVSQVLNTSATVNITFFNFDGNGDNLTLYAPQGTVVSPAQFTEVSLPSQHKFEVTTHASGNQTFYATLEPLNCTLNYTLTINNTDDKAPKAISNLSRIAATNTSFTLEWDAPGDPDFSHVEVYLDGAFFANVTQDELVVDELPKGVPHNVTIYSVDLNGNKNATAVELFDVRPYFEEGCIAVPVTCDDGNPATLDYCSTESLDGLVCIHRPINLYGHITDEYGNNLSGEQISLYDASVFTISNESATGDFDAIVPKQDFDFETDENGSYYGFADPTKVFHLAINGSIKRDYEVQTHKKKQKIDDTPIEKPANFPIILPESGDVNVLFESASAGLQSDLLIESPVQGVIVNNSQTGVSANYSGLNAGDEIVLSIFVHADAWGLPTYKHYSNDSDYAIVERVDYNTWRVRFEDLDAAHSDPDWDYNDVVALIGLDTVINDSYNNTAQDCDNDGYLNWQDNDDEDCDINEHDSEVDENSTQWSTDYNVAGHIIYGGEFENENRYACGDQVRFVMFGRNNGEQDLNITYYVESHVNGGPPEDAGAPCVESGDILYCGDDQDPSQTLYLPPDGEKYTKYFDFEVPCDYPQGRYDIHVQHNPKWGNMHKIGNFFVIPDTTAPGINANPAQITTYTNETVVDIFYTAQDVPQPGSLRAEIAQIAILTGSTLDVTIDKDIHTDGEDVDGNPANDADLLLAAGNNFFNLTYNESGHYVAQIKATDASNNTATFNITVDVYITEEEARTIYIEMINGKWNNTYGITYEESGGDADANDFKENYVYYDDACEEINVDVFFQDDQFATFTHMEYMTPLNTLRNPTYYTNITQNSTNVDEPVGGTFEYLTAQCLSALDTRNSDATNYAHYILAVSNMTETEFRGNVSNYLDTVWCKENAAWC